MFRTSISCVSQCTCVVATFSTTLLMQNERTFVHSKDWNARTDVSHSPALYILGLCRLPFSNRRKPNRTTYPTSAQVCGMKKLANSCACTNRLYRRVHHEKTLKSKIWTSRRDIFRCFVNDTLCQDLFSLENGPFKVAPAGA